MHSATIWKFDLDIYPVYYIQARIKTTKCNIFLRADGTSQVIGYILVSRLLDWWFPCPVYWTGDFNVHVNNLSDTFTIELEGLLEMFKLLQRVKDSMHRLGSTLDLLVWDSDLEILDFNITDIAVSDHLLSCFINLSKVAPTFITGTSWNWWDFNVDMFGSEVVATLGADNS